MNQSDIVCSCTGVTVGDIETAISRGAKSFEAVQAETGISNVCGACRDSARNIVRELLD